MGGPTRALLRCSRSPSTVTPKSAAGAFERGAVEGNSLGSRGRVQRAHATRGTAAHLGPTRSSRIVSPIDNVRRRRCRARRRVASHSGDNATAPRSARYGWRYRGSHEGSLHSPPCDPRLLSSTAPRSFSRPNSSPTACTVGSGSFAPAALFGTRLDLESFSLPVAVLVAPTAASKSRHRERREGPALEPSLVQRFRFRRFDPARPGWLPCVCPLSRPPARYTDSNSTLHGLQGTQWTPSKQRAS